MNQKTITLKVIAGAKKNLIKEENGQLKVYVTAPPVDGKANKLVIALLSEHFGVSKSQIEMTKGLQSRIKTISIYPNSH
jgi:uncharacterized protein (TIGR00251 family)